MIGRSAGGSPTHGPPAGGSPTDLPPTTGPLTAGPPWISAEQVFERVGYADAAAAVRSALEGGLDPALDIERRIVGLAAGQMLLMPSESGAFAGVKIATVAPDNPALGRERIQGVYLLMDARSLTPVALIDGVALTTLRTAAVSAAAAALLAPAHIGHLLVFGSGPQARGHVAAMRAIRPIDRLTVVARDAGRAAAFADEVSSDGLPSTAGKAGDVRDAQLIVCATTARTPLFDGSLVPADSCTIAVGSHEPDAREVDSALIARSQVVVEDVAVALREAGDVIVPIGEGAIDAESLVPLAAIVRGATEVDRTRPRVFSSSGMSWEDLVVATEVYRRG